MELFERARFRRTALVLAVLIMLLSASLISVVAMWAPGSSDLEKPLPEGFYLGITSGGSVAETELLIDKVKGYVNMVIFTNLTVTMNQTSLEELSDYAFNSGLSFLVFVLYPSPRSNFTYNPISWEAEAKALYGDKFMGYYLWDEPGGHQVDRGNFRQFDNTTMPSDYRDAANTYVYYLYIQMRDFIKTDKLFTTDYALYWYDYEAGYDVVLSQFGWNLSRPLNIAQCRGAAEMHNKTWGAMVTWTYQKPPYIASPAEVYQDMITAYSAGAQYVTVFNYPKVEQYGLLSEAHFEAIKDFKRYVLANPQDKTSKVDRVDMFFQITMVSVYADLTTQSGGFGVRTATHRSYGMVL